MARHIQQRTLMYTRRSPERTRPRQVRAVARPAATAANPAAQPAPKPVAPPSTPFPKSHPAPDRLTRWLTIAGIALVVVASAVVAATSGWAAGAVVLVLGLGIAVLMHPATWSAGDRGRAASGRPPEQPENETRY